MNKIFVFFINFVSNYLYFSIDKKEFTIHKVNIFFFYWKLKLKNKILENNFFPVIE